jgi:hypothetical protein
MVIDQKYLRCASDFAWASWLALASSQLWDSAWGGEAEQGCGSRMALGLLRPWDVMTSAWPRARLSTAAVEA